MATELTAVQQVSESIAALQAALLSANPAMPTMLRTIHKQLQADKDIVTLLTPEEVGILVSGLLSQTNTVIAAAAVKTAKSKSKKLSAITLDDL